MRVCAFVCFSPRALPPQCVSHSDRGQPRGCCAAPRAHIFFPPRGLLTTKHPLARVVVELPDPAVQMERVATSPPPPPGGVAVTMSPPPPPAAPAAPAAPASGSDDDALPPPESFEVTAGLRIAERERGGGGRARWWRCAAAARPAREASVSRRMEALFGETQRENMLHVRLRGMASLAIGLLIIASVKVRSLCTRALAMTRWREVYWVSRVLVCSSSLTTFVL